MKLKAIIAVICVSLLAVIGYFDIQNARSAIEYQRAIKTNCMTNTLRSEAGREWTEALTKIDEQSAGDAVDPDFKEYLHKRLAPFRTLDERLKHIQSIQCPPTP